MEDLLEALEDLVYENCNKDTLNFDEYEKEYGVDLRDNLNIEGIKVCIDALNKPTRAEAVAELEERVRDTLYAEFTELGQVDLDVVNYIASRITNTILREGEEGKGVSDSEIRFEFFFLFEEFVQRIFVKPNEE